MPSKIVIVGAGFVGLPAARHIKKKLGDDADVLLIDQKDHFLFAPRLIDALAGDVNESQIRTDLGLIADRCGFRFLKAHVDRIDRKKQRVHYSPEKSVPYDVLILCEGAKTAYRDIPGSQEHTCCLKSLDDVYEMHGHIQNLVELAKQVKTNEEKASLLTCVVVGGGASGIETLMALKRYAEKYCDQRAPRLTKLWSFSLLESGPQILNGFPLNIVRGTMKELKRHNIALAIGEAVSCVQNTCVMISDNKKKMPAMLTVWAAGIVPNMIPLDPEAHRDQRGNLIVDSNLQIEPKIFAAGDVVTFQEKNITVPKNAQTALLMSRTIAENAVRTVRGQHLVPFHYTSKGSILWLGKNGYVNTPVGSIKTRLAVTIRELFYRYRHWQITRG